MTRLRLFSDNPLLSYESKRVHITDKCAKKVMFPYTQGSTLLTPSFGNHLFANYHVLKHPLTNLILAYFYISKVLKSAAKNMEIGSQIKI